jgi:hypothetical protein
MVFKLLPPGNGNCAGEITKTMVLVQLYTAVPRYMVMYAILLGVNARIFFRKEFVLVLMKQLYTADIDDLIESFCSQHAA